VNPGKHNIFDFFHFSKSDGEARLTSSRQRRTRPIWSVLNRQSRTTALVNIPMTFPPDSVSGVMISGFPFGEATTGYTYPPDLEKTLGEYPLDLFGESIQPGGEAKLLERFRMGLERQAVVAKKLLDQEDWDLFWIVFTGTDKVQHFYWKYSDRTLPGYDPVLAERYGTAIRDFWTRVDQVVGEIADQVGEDADLLVISDHGFAPIRRELRLWNWLKSEGFVAYENDDPRQPIIRAFPPGPFAGLVRVNEKGRDFDGRVEPGDESRRVLDDVRAKLEALKDPLTGEPFVEKIYTREELFHGPYAGDAPDLVFLEKKERFVSRGSVQTPEIFGPPSYTFSAFHRPEGVLLARGPHVPPRTERGTYSILDVTPTILWMLGATMPKDLDGDVMEDLVGKEALAARPPVVGEESVVQGPETIAITEEGRQELEGLGYVR
jgi:predicted AlkP superfamily phosphohydrolase/phosphomutase